MQSGDIILVQGHSLISAAISLFTHGGFSHSALATSETTILEAMPEGIVEVPMHYNHYAVFRVMCILEHERTAAVEHARSYLGVPYDYNQGLGFALNAFRKLLGIGKINNLLDHKNKLSCGSVIDLAFRESGIILRPDRSPGDVTPIGLSYSPLIRMVEHQGLWEI